MRPARSYPRSLLIPALLFAAACGGDRDSSEQYAMQREECTFERGALPVETLGTSVPLGDQIPNDPNGQRALGYFDGSDLLFYWDLYSTFAMSDHHHCSMLGGTYPNRWYYLSATSVGMTTNNFIPEERFTPEP